MFTLKCTFQAYQNNVMKKIFSIVNSEIPLILSTHPYRHNELHQIKIWHIPFYEYGGMCSNQLKQYTCTMYIYFILKNFIVDHYVIKCVIVSFMYCRYRTAINLETNICHRPQNTRNKYDSFSLYRPVYFMELFFTRHSKICQRQKLIQTSHNNSERVGN